MDRIETAFENLIKMIKEDVWDLKGTEDAHYLKHRSKPINVYYNLDEVTSVCVTINSEPIRFELTDYQRSKLEDEIKFQFKAIRNKKFSAMAETQLQTLLN